jgi:glycerol-3-phosphate dehydrogenase (NAD(P)+)
LSTETPQTDKRLKVAVLGAGSFGSVLANIMALNSHEVCVWVRNKAHCEVLSESHINTRYLDNFKLHERIRFSNELAEVVAEVDFVFLAIPSKGFRDMLANLKPLLSKEVVIVSTAKGIEPNTFKLMTEVVQEELPENKIAALSGPNIAAEIAKGELTGSVVASSDAKVNETVQALLSSRFFRVYDNPDLFGVELAGSLKNIYAIASGMSFELGMGDNARAMLLTRALAEMSRFAVAKGANPMTFLGLAGVGDLFVTCTSTQSRNFRLGVLLAQGEEAENAISKIGSAVEGYSTVATVFKEAERLDIYMPLVSALYKILYESEDILSVVKDLMLGNNNHDVEFIQGT